MSGLLPPEVPLDHPPGSPAAFDDAVEGLRGAGARLWFVEAGLAGPEAQAPRWLGADAAAAAAEVGVTRQTTAAVRGAVTAAVAGLATHREVLVAARARIEVLRSEQSTAFADAERRLTTLADPSQAGAVLQAPAAAALVDEVAAADADRAVEHAALLAEVAEHAATVVATLSAATAGLGGTGGTGPVAAAAVQVHLAGVLPGYGARARTDVGRDVAEELLRVGTADEVRATARRCADLLADPGVAVGAVAALGRTGLDQLLLQAAGDEELAGVLAVALTTAAGATGAVAAAEAVLDGVLDPADPDAAQDSVAFGMGAVLAAPGAGPDLAARWLPRLLAREEAQGVRAVDRVSSTAADPVTVAVQVVAGAGRPDLAVGVLDSTAAWDRLLARGWADGAVAFADLVALAAEAGPGAGPVAEAALRSVGSALLPGADGVVHADPATWDRVAPHLAAVVVAQPEVLVAPLADALADGAAELLSGAAFLLADVQLQAVVVPAVEGALGGLPPGVPGSVVVGALTAVRDQAGDVAWLIGCARALDVAVDRRLFWDTAITLPLQAVRGTVGGNLRAVAGLAAGWLGFDGTPVLPTERAVPAGAPGALAAAEALTGSAGGAGLAYVQVRRMLDLGNPAVPAAGSPADLVPGPVDRPR